MNRIVLPLYALYQLHDLIQALLVHMVMIGLTVSFSVRQSRTCQFLDVTLLCSWFRRGRRGGRGLSREIAPSSSRSCRREKNAKAKTAWLKFHRSLSGKHFAVRFTYALENSTL